MLTYHYIFFGLSFLVFALYFLAIYWKYGIQPSISDTYYTIWNRSPNPNNRWWFTLALWGFAFPLAIVGVEIHSMFWFAAVFIMFVGAAPAFKSRTTQRTIHIIGAIGGIALALLGFLAVNMFFIVGLTLGFILYAYINRIPNRTWWVETAAFLTTWLGLLIAHI